MTITTNPCILCGKTSTMELDPDKLARYQAGEHVQNVWPEKSPGERELLITGTHPQCWDSMFKEEE